MTIWANSWEMAMAAPVVMANRLTRIAATGPSPGPRDRLERVRMVQEKLDASGESMRAAAIEIGNANQQLFRIFAHSAWTGVPPGWAGLTQSVLTSWFQVLERSIAPFHRRVMSNERRLLKH